MASLNVWLFADNWPVLVLFPGDQGTGREVRGAAADSAVVECMGMKSRPVQVPAATAPQARWPLPKENATMMVLRRDLLTG
jgi:hypothetical protein